MEKIQNVCVTGNIVIGLIFVIFHFQTSTKLFLFLLPDKLFNMGQDKSSILKPKVPLVTAKPVKPKTTASPVTGKEKSSIRKLWMFLA